MALMKYELYLTCKAGGKFAASLISAVSVYIHYSTTTKATVSVSHQSDLALEMCDFLPLKLIQPAFFVLAGKNTPCGVPGRYSRSG